MTKNVRQESTRRMNRALAASPIVRSSPVLWSSLARPVQMRIRDDDSRRQPSSRHFDGERPGTVLSPFHIALRPLTVGVFVLVSSSGCGPAQGRGLTLAGSTSLQPFAEKWAEAYHARQPGLAIHVQGGGSTAGVQAAKSGAAQIGMSSRPLTLDETSGVIGVPVARDGIAMVVHPTSQVNDLTLDQVRAIYAGDIRNWRLFGGRDRSITVITREEGSGTRSAFEALVMDRRRIAAFALVQDSTGTVRQMVASDPAAIGYVSVGLVDASVKALRLGGADPSEPNIDAGRYPLVRPLLFVVAPGEDRGATRDFIDWITGPEGRDLTRREGLLPPGP